MADQYFKTVFKGYDRRQVDDFLIEQSDTYAEKEREAAKKLEAAEKEIANLKDELALLRSENERAEREHAEAIAAKNAEYESLCAEIGTRIITAEKRAEDIIANAESEAEKARASAIGEARKEADEIIANAKKESAEMIETTRKNCEEVNRAANEFHKHREEIQRSIDDAERRFDTVLGKLRLEILNKGE